MIVRTEPGLWGFFGLGNTYFGKSQSFQGVFSLHWRKRLSFIWEIQALKNRGKVISHLRIGYKDWTWNSFKFIVLFYYVPQGVFSCKNVCPRLSILSWWQHVTEALRMYLDPAAPPPGGSSMKLELCKEIVVMFITGLLIISKKLEIAWILSK